MSIGSTDAYELPVPGVCPACKGMELAPSRTPGVDECGACGTQSRAGRRVTTSSSAGGGADQDRVRRLEAFAEQVVALDETYGGQDVVVAELARQAKEALA